MRVFLSWSGDESRQVAEALRSWLPSVIQAAKPYFSPSDIDKGTQWNASVSKELNASAIGILCITKDNLHAPWIMFEAGALSKSLDNARVIPLLIGLEPTDLTGPLAQFQATRFEQGEVRKMMGVINAQLGEQALGGDVLTSVFDMFWPILEKKITEIRPPQRLENTHPRTERDLLEEVLTIVRDISFSPGRDKWDNAAQIKNALVLQPNIPRLKAEWLMRRMSELEFLWFNLSDASKEFLGGRDIINIHQFADLKNDFNLVATRASPVIEKELTRLSEDLDRLEMGFLSISGKQL